MSEPDKNPQPYSVRLPPDVRKKLEECAKQNGRSLHAEILLRLSVSVEDPKLGVPDNINDLGEKIGYVTRSEVEAMILEAIGKNKSR